jgi:hypothetical protein
MKVIIAGSRTITNYSLVVEAVKKSGFEITEVVSGGAGGVDRLGEEWAFEHKVPVKKFPADWKKHGKAAGMIRNKQMVEYSDALIAIWDSQSPGTANTIKNAKKKGIKLYVLEVKGKEDVAKKQVP